VYIIILMKAEHKKFILENIGKRSTKAIAENLGIKERKIRKFLDEAEDRPRQAAARNIIVSEKNSFFSGKTYKTILFIIFFFVLGLAIYVNSFGNEFVFDDEHHIVNNTVIRDFKNLPDVFTHHLTYFGGQENEGKFYRPIETVTFIIDYFLWRLEPMGYHITNALLHIFVCVLLFFVMRFITGSAILSAVISSLYLVHPIHTEAVAYASGRADSLSSIFLLTMVILLYRYWLSEKRYIKTIYYFLILTALLLALLSKELAMVFPFLLMFFEYCLRKKERYRNLIGKKIIFYLPFFALIGVWFFFKNKISPTEPGVIDVPSISTRLTTVPKLILDYIRISFFPLNLHMEYKLPFPGSLLQSGYFEPFLFIFFFVALVYYVWKRGRTNTNYRIMFFGLGWFLIGLLPYLSIVFPLNAPFAEHWLYIPEMGFILFVIYFILYQLRKQRWAEKCVLFSCVVIIGIYSCLTIKQNAVWKNGITFYEHTIKYAPYSAKAHNNLGVEYMRKGDKAKAKGLFKRALELDPNYKTAAENLSLAK